MSGTDHDTNLDRWLDTDYKQDRQIWQKRFRRLVRGSITSSDWEAADSRWRPTRGWLSH